MPDETSIKSSDMRLKHVVSGKDQTTTRSLLISEVGLLDVGNYVCALNLTTAFDEPQIFS